MQMTVGQDKITWDYNDPVNDSIVSIIMYQDGSNRVEVQLWWNNGCYDVSHFKKYAKTTQGILKNVLPHTRNMVRMGA